MRWILGLVALGVFVGSVPAGADVQQLKASGDVTVHGVARDEFDLGGRPTGNPPGRVGSDTFFETLTRLRVDADLMDNVRAALRLINERDWNSLDRSTLSGTGNVDDDDVDLDLAYVQVDVGETFFLPVTLTLGRQEVTFGNGLVLGDADTNAIAPSTLLAGDFSLRKSFDAVRATVDLWPWTVDGVYLRIDESNLSELTAGGTFTRDDEVVWGVNVARNLREVSKTEVEGYAFLNRDEAIDQQLWVVGLRGESQLTAGLTVGWETAYQFGRNRDPAGRTSVDHQALALQGSAEYAFEQPLSPVLGVRASWLSGDDDPLDPDNTGWDPLYEDQRNGLIANRILGGDSTLTSIGGVNTNALIFGLTGSVAPFSNVVVSADYFFYQLLQDFNGRSVTNAAGTSFLMTEDRRLAQEVDLGLEYGYTEDVSFGFLAGWFVPGPAFHSQNDALAREAVASVSVVF